MEGLFEELLRKSQMLASWTREKVDSVNRLQTAWERLHSLLDNYEHIIAKQVYSFYLILQQFIIYNKCILKKMLHL